MNAHRHDHTTRQISRREVLQWGFGAGALGVLAACAPPVTQLSAKSTTTSTTATTSTTTTTTTTSTTTPSGAAPTPTTFPARGSVGITTPKAQLPVTTPLGGALQANSAGQVIANQYVKGGIEVNAPNVVLRNCFIEQQVGGGWMNVAQHSTATNLTLEDCTIIPVLGAPNGGRQQAAVWNESASGLTMRRCEVARTTQAALSGTNVLIEDSWVHDLLPYPEGGSPHKECFMSMGGGPVVLRRNRFETNLPTNMDPGSHTAAVFFQPWSDIVDVTIDHCFLMGGYYSLRAEDPDPARKITGHVKNLSVTNCVFGPQPVQGGAPVLIGASVTVGTWSSNRIGDANGAPGATLVPRP